MPKNHWPLWHYKRGKVASDFSALLLGIAQKIAPVLTIIDGVIAMEGDGPASGEPRNIGWLIASSNMIAADTVCCHLVSRKQSQVPVSLHARHLGLVGHDFNTIEIVGDPIANHIVTDFAYPNLMPIRFSPIRIAKSIAKQCLLKLKQKHACQRGNP